MQKSKYETHVKPNLALITGWARQGADDKTIAAKLGVNRSTLWEYRKKYPELDAALREGKEFADTTVENALYRRAIGYDYEEKTIEKRSGEINTKIVTRHVPGDVTAQLKWLFNRRPAEWRDRVEQQAQNEQVGMLSDFTKIIADKDEEDANVKAPTTESK